MFVSLSNDLLARFEPSNSLIYLLHRNELRTLPPGTSSYDILRPRLPVVEWGQAFPAVPLNVQIQVTKGCNYECGFCYANSSKGAIGLDMPLQKLKWLTRYCFEWGVANIQYVGGEPFFRKDFAEIVDYTASFGLSQSIITNGLIPGTSIKTWENVLKKFSKIQVSMNGVNAVYNKSIGGNLFEKFLIALARVCKMNQNTWLSCVISEETAAQIEDILRVARDVGAKGVRFGVLARTGRASDADYSYFRKVLPQAERQLLEFGQKFPSVTIESHFNPLLSQSLMETHKSVTLKFRDEAHSVLFVDKDGNAFPFPLLGLNTFRLGNVFTDDVMEMWRTHPVLMEMRNPENLAPECKNCPTPCSLSSRSIALLWTGDIRKKVPCSRFNYQA
jgi:MoaA/NifB/PqqE/SkfB family radical SAM enzyme